jgi:hypothetical protein
MCNVHQWVKVVSPSGPAAMLMMLRFLKGWERSGARWTLDGIRV